MKKLLVFIMLQVCGSGAFAQGYGGLRIDNLANPCEVYINMSATDPSSGYPGVCGLVSNTIVVPAGTAQTWCTVFDFEGVYVCGISAPVGWGTGPGIPASSKEFNWTDISFAFNCPAWALAAGYCGTGGVMSNPASSFPALTCYGVPGPWITPGPCTPIHASWTKVTCPGGLGCYGDAELIKFW